MPLHALRAILHTRVRYNCNAHVPAWTDCIAGADHSFIYLPAIYPSLPSIHLSSRTNASHHTNLQSHVMMVSNLIVTPEDSPAGCCANPQHLHWVRSEHRFTGLAVAQPQPDTSHVLAARSDGAVVRLRLKNNPFASEEEPPLELLPGGSDTWATWRGRVVLPGALLP